MSLLRQQNQQQEQQNEILYLNFINTCKTKITKSLYTNRLRYFMDFLGAKNYTDLIINKDKKTIENDIKSFLVYLREKRKITYVSASQYLNAVKKFYYVNSEYDLKWSLIKMYLGNDDTDDDSSTIQENPSNYDEENGIEVDRPYTRAEIQKMLTTATDPRVKIVILLMSSSGIRIGGIPQLKLRNLTKIQKFSNNIYQINVYEKSRKFNYKTFCTPECASAIDSYLNYRKHAGENLNGNSPLIREQFNPQDHFKLNNPRHIGIGGIKYLVNEVLIKHSALKQKIEYDYENKRKKKRHPTMLTHSLRKYFDTEARKAGVYPDFVELLMGHKLPGVRKHYFKPDMHILLEGTKECKGYVAAIDSLTINNENRLEEKVQQLEEQDDYQKYVIDKKMKEKDSQIKALQESIKFLSDTVNRALLADPTNKIITTTESDGMIVKGIELKPEINNKAIGEIAIPSSNSSSTNSNNKKK